jgi:hypothetical protein
MDFHSNTVLRRNSSAPAVPNNFITPPRNGGKVTGPPKKFTFQPWGVPKNSKRLFCSGIGFNTGRPFSFRDTNVSEEEKELRKEISVMESNLEALQDKIINKRKEEKALNTENRKKKMGTINCLEAGLNGMHLMGSEQKDIFISILYILKDFDNRLKIIEGFNLPPPPLCAQPDTGLPPVAAGIFAMRRTTDELAAEAEASGDKSRANLIREAQSVREKDYGSDNDLFDRLRELERDELVSKEPIYNFKSGLKQTKITEFLNGVNCVVAPPNEECCAPSPVSSNNGWDMDCDWENDGVKFVDFDSSDVKVQDQPRYEHCS